MSPRLTLGLVAVVIAGSWVLRYPPAIAIQDEAAYLAQARIFARGELVGTSPEDATISMLTARGGVVAKYPPAQAALLAPTQWGPWRLAFIVPLLALALTTVLVAGAFERDGRSPLWALLVLLHPTLLLYARTLMSEPLAALVLTAAFVWSDPRRPRPLLAGLALGAAPAVRLALVPVAALFGIVLVYRLWRADRRADMARAVAGACVPIFVLVVHNFIAFGSALYLTPAQTGSFDWATAGERFLFYALALNLAWPLLAVGAALSRHTRAAEVRGLLGFMVVFYGAYYFVDRRFGLPADFVIGLRFFAPVLPILVIAFAERLHAWTASLPHRAVVLGGAAVVAMAADFAMIEQHHALLRRVSDRRDRVLTAVRPNEVVVVHGGAAELLSPAWGAPAFTLASTAPELVSTVRDRHRAGARVLGVAQGPPADTLVALTPNA
ncbi:MAG: hypothetical protein JSW43_03870, partial [Gemmatimonadota bacterium]